MQSVDEDLEIPDEPDEPDEPENGEICPNEDAVREKFRLLASKQQIEARLKGLSTIEGAKIVLPRHHCCRCGHDWIGRNPEGVPAQCPRCGICLWWQMPTRIGAKIEGVGGLSDKWRQRRSKKRGKSCEERARVTHAAKPVRAYIPRIRATDIPFVLPAPVRGIPPEVREPLGGHPKSEPEEE
jgi:hypothetical protein